MIYREGTVVFVGSWENNKEDAREYCKQQGLKAEDVKLVKRGDAICVVLKRDVEYEGG